MRPHTIGAIGLLSAVWLWAQVPYGHITGRVTDSSGAVVPQATVETVNLQTNVVASTRSNSEGNFELRNLIPGEYRLRAEMTGFKRYERGPLELRVGDVLSIPVTLEVGAQTESVTVTTEAPLLESATASVGQLIDTRRILEMPMPASNPLFLTLVVPNIVGYEHPGSTWTPEAHPHVTNFSAAGTPVGNNDMAIDGMPNMRGGGTIGNIPPPEIVQEFRVDVTAYDASLGHFSGAQVNVVLRSGTNTPHGSVVFAHASRPFNAVPYFTNRNIHDLSTGPVNKAKIDRLWPFRRHNRYRGTGGGPVYIPKVYDGRNRTFWQYAGDYLYMPYPTGTYWTVPTLKQRQGDFSELLALGSQYQIYDPATTVPASGGRFSRLPLAGNIIPPSRIDPIANKLLAYYPLPNASASADGRNNYTGAPLSFVDYNSHWLRIDQTLGQNHRIYGSYNLYHVYALQNIYFGKTGGEYGRGGTQDNWHRALTLDDVLSLRPDLVVNLRYGLMRFTTKSPPPHIGFNLAALGLAPELVRQRDPKLTTMPSISIDGYEGLGGGSGGYQTRAIHNLFATVSHMRGNHSLRFGNEVRVFPINNYSFGNISPSYSFGTTWTRGEFNTSPASPIGQGLASFLFGKPTGGSIDNNASYAEISKYYSWYIHDDWKVTRKLTVNLGIRHEIEFPTTERYNRTTRGFDSTTPNPVQAAAQAAYAKSPIPEVPASQFRTPGGPLFAGVGGVPAGLYDLHSHNFLPRIGLAYQLRQKTVLRAGYGIFFGSFGADRRGVSQMGFSQSTTLVPSLDNGQSFRADLRNPFPDGLLQPAGASAGLTTYVGRGVSFFDPKDRPHYMQRWSFNIQQEFPHRVLLEVGYTGNRGTALGVSENYNALPGQYLSRTGVRDQATINYLSAVFPNPFLGMPEFAGSGLTGNTVSRSQLLLPYPHFTGVSATRGSGFSWYHAFSARAEKRFSHGYTVQVSYTWSKNMEAISRLNDSDAALEHAISGSDRQHHFAASGIYELPLGRGRRWLASVPGWANQIVGGWSAQTVFLGQSGAPIGFGNIIFRGDLHDIVLPESQRTVEQWFNINAGFERNSAQQLGSNLRTFPSRLTGLRTDGINVWNLGAIKKFPLTEHVDFEIRAEAKNGFNHPNFGGPNTGVTSTLFGQVNGTAGGAREMLISARLSW